MSALIYHTGALGDFITTIPAIRYWKKQAPVKKITLLGKPAIGKFARDIGLIDHWLDVDNPKLLPLFYEDFSDRAKKLLEEFSTAVLFTNVDSLILRHIKQSGIHTVFWQPPFPLSPTHVIDYHLSLFCDPGTILPEDKIPFIVPSATAFSDVKKFIDPEKNRWPVAIHPGSGSIKKNWPFDNFLGIAEHFRTKNIPVLWIKGPAEESLHYPAKDTIVSNPDLSVLAALLSHCRVFVGNDSGVTHLAAAVGCPTVAIFGPSDQEMWGPRGKMVHVICNNTGHTCDKSVDEVLEQMQRIKPIESAGISGQIHEEASPRYP